MKTIQLSNNSSFTSQDFVHYDTGFNNADDSRSAHDRRMKRTHCNRAKELFAPRIWQSLGSHLLQRLDDHSGWPRSKGSDSSYCAHVVKTARRAIPQ